MLSPGQIILGYRVEHMLGEGAMGAVFLGSDLRNGNAVAIKVLKDNSDPELVKRFHREAAILTRLAHLNLVGILAFGDASVGATNVFALVMEMVSGPSLRAWMLGSKSMTVHARATALVGFVRAIAAGLQTAHDAGFVHRDVKPENILLRNGVLDAPVLVDFGLGRDLAASKLTHTGQILGTPRYMPPEQLRSQVPTPAVDQYAFASVLYEAIAGVPVFVASNIAELVTKILAGNPPRIETHAQLSDVLLRALASAPQQRYARVSDFAQAFAAAMVPQVVALHAPQVTEPQVTEPSVSAWRSQSDGVVNLTVALGSTRPVALVAVPHVSETVHAVSVKSRPAGVFALHEFVGAEQSQQYSRGSAREFVGSAHPVAVAPSPVDQVKQPLMQASVRNHANEIRKLRIAVWALIGLVISAVAGGFAVAWWRAVTKPTEAEKTASALPTPTPSEPRMLARADAGHASPVAVNNTVPGRIAALSTPRVRTTSEAVPHVVPESAATVDSDPRACIERLDALLVGSASANAYAQRGDCHLRLEQYESARRDYETACRLGLTHDHARIAEWLGNHNGRCL